MKTGWIVLACATALVLAALGALLIAAVIGQPRDSSEIAALKDHFYRRGVQESGALNLVSAIYLGYRAFDTLGETIVLVLSVAGVLLITGVRE